MTNPLTKRVTMIELFYDLVFVYMISRATGLIHHLNQGIVNLSNFRFSKQLFWLMSILTISGLCLTILHPTMPMLILTSTLLAMLITGLIVHSLIYQSKLNKQ